MTDRIKPFYDVRDTEETTRLFAANDATISQRDKQYKGRVEITQYWESMTTRIAFFFDDGQSPEMQFGESSITAPGVRDPITLDIGVIADEAVRGFVTTPVELGTDHKLDRVTFHLPNLSNFDGAKHRVEDNRGGGGTIDAWWQVVLEDDGWQITIQSRPVMADMLHGRPANRPVRFTALGDIRRADGRQFKRREVIPALDALHLFLSLAEAEWIPPLFIVGSNGRNPKTWERFTAFMPSSPRHYGRLAESCRCQ
jgi:hypothetical protein